MRAGLLLCASSPQSTRQYITLWSTAARSGWGIAGVFSDDCGSGTSPGLDELRQMIARRSIDVVLAWSADHLSHALRDELRAAGCGLYSHEPGTQSPDAGPEQKGQTGIARARVQRLGRPRVDSATEEAVQAALATGKGIRKVAREVGVGVSVVQRVRAERTPAPHPIKWDPVERVPSRTASWSVTPRGPWRA